MNFLQLLQEALHPLCTAKLTDITDVGSTKAVGWLEANNIRDLGSSIRELTAFAEKHLLQYKICKRENGAYYLYVWNSHMLTHILTSYKTILQRDKIPTEASKYIQYIANTTVDYQQMPQSYAVVAKTFNDKRFREVSRKQILDNTFDRNSFFPVSKKPK